MSATGTKFALKAGTEVLIVYALRGGASARFLPAAVKSSRRYDMADRIYEPAQLLEGISLAEALSAREGVKALATQTFEDTLYAVAADAMGAKAANRLTVFADQHHLVVVDSQQVLEA